MLSLNSKYMILFGVTVRERIKGDCYQVFFLIKEFISTLNIKFLISILLHFS